MNGPTASSFTEIVGQNDVFIAVMGLSGSGKSSLIASCTGREVLVGHSLSSCTTAVSMYSFNYWDKANNKKRVHLIDTPGFDDNQRSEVDILQEIAFWLTKAYDASLRLNGIVYLHDVRAPRFEGSPQCCFEIFKALVGESNFGAVYLATTFWDEVCRRNNFRQASKRHDQLEDEYWQPLLDNGAQMRPPPDIESDVTSVGLYSWTQDMLAYFVDKPVKYVLQIQLELRDTNAQLAETTAGSLATSLWSTSAVNGLQISELKKSRTDLVQQWSIIVQNDVERMDREIERLNQAIRQREPTPLYSSTHEGGNVQELIVRRDEIHNRKMLKLTSYGFVVQGLSAAIGFGSLVTGVLALGTAAACNIM